MNMWQQIEQVILPNLSDDDDPFLWQNAINLIFHDASFLARSSSETALITAVVGCCSHWLRPHQTRWKADGGFAWPTGYGGHGFSRTGQPEHDWSTEFYWILADQAWQIHQQELEASEKFTLRVTIPARTSRHNQAAIPVTWENGTPVLSKKPIYQIYGFRKLSNRWKCTAINESGAEHYELAAEHRCSRFLMRNDTAAST